MLMMEVARFLFVVLVDATMVEPWFARGLGDRSV